MTQSAPDKLIDDNLWRDIAEAPRDGTYILAMTIKHQSIICVRWDDEWQGWINETTSWYGSETLSHFRPLPDDRCANALKVAMDAFNEVKKIGEDGSLSDDRKLFVIGVELGVALAEIERIAGGE